MSEPCDLTAVEARRLIGTKQLSASELLESCIARIESVDHAVNAMVARDFDRARTAAKAADAAVARGDTLPPLHGLPIGIKDLEPTEGLRTTFGSPLFRDNVPASDKRLVAAIRAAGAIVIGKTNTPEFGAGANTRNAVYGATGNPFDPQKSCAGSSGGSAVALATGMAPLCQGSDTGGSLRNPAAFCGIVGFRPTPGLVPTERRAHGWSGLSVVGPMGRTVADTALLLSAIAGDDAGDPLATTIHGKTVRDPARFLPARAARPGRPARRADPRFRLRPHRETYRLGLRRKDQHCSATSSPAPTTRHPIVPAPTKRSRCCAPSATSTSHLDKVRNTPDLVGPNVRANVEARPALQRPGYRSAPFHCRPSSTTAGSRSSKATTSS